MDKLLLMFLKLIIIVTLANGVSPIGVKEPTRCGEWLAFKDEKCFKIADRAGYQTKEDAEVVCESYAADLHRESFPRLITIKSKEELDFLQQFIFVENNIFDNVWLGLMENGSSGKFLWNDGTKVYFSNWANQSLSDEQHHCVQLESGKGIYEAGRWAKVHCQKKNLVVCERTQTMTLEALQETFLNYKAELERKLKASDLEIETLQKDLKTEANKVAAMLQNPVPLGFIYAQLPGQSSPNTLWPQATWKDVGQDYAGLFFRVEGGNAAPFGQEQQDNSRHILEVENAYTDENTWLKPLPTAGQWSAYIWTGTDASARHVAMRFRFQAGEIRPRNKAIKIWQRIK